jgi:hypothetical protein
LVAGLGLAACATVSEPPIADSICISIEHLERAIRHLSSAVIQYPHQNVSARNRVSPDEHVQERTTNVGRVSALADLFGTLTGTSGQAGAKSILVLDAIHSMHRAVMDLTQDLAESGRRSNSVSVGDLVRCREPRREVQRL